MYIINNCIIYILLTIILYWPFWNWCWCNNWCWCIEKIIETWFSQQNNLYYNNHNARYFTRKSKFYAGIFLKDIIVLNKRHFEFQSAILIDFVYIFYIYIHLLLYFIIYIPFSIGLSRRKSQNGVTGVLEIFW